MKKKIMYVKPFAEKVYMENVLPLANGSKASGNAGQSDDDGDFGSPAKGFSWDDEDDDQESGKLFSNKSPWDGFKN
jgi:hypothetical protein